MQGSSSAVPGAPTPEKSTRLGAALIDGVIAFILTAFLGGLPLLGGVVGAAYLVVRDGLELGPIRYRSVGKHLMGLSVVRLDGKPLSLETSVLRNWMFGLGALAGILTAVPLVGGLIAPLASIGGLALILYEVYAVFTDPSGRRWGDRLGHTKVVQTGRSSW